MYKIFIKCEYISTIHIINKSQLQFCTYNHGKINKLMNTNIPCTFHMTKQQKDTNFHQTV